MNLMNELRNYLKTANYGLENDSVCDRELRAMYLIWEHESGKNLGYIVENQIRHRFNKYMKNPKYYLEIYDKDAIEWRKPNPIIYN